MEIWPQYPVRILSPWTLITAIPIMVIIVNILSLKNSGQVKRKTIKATVIPHCGLEWKIAISCA